MSPNGRAFTRGPYFDPQQTMTYFVTVTVSFVFYCREFLCNYVSNVFIYCYFVTLQSQTNQNRNSFSHNFQINAFQQEFVLL